MNKCLICDELHSGKKLSDHIRKFHKLNSEEYTIKLVYNGLRPLCKNCNLETRYTSFSFKEYCKDCSKIASSNGGKKGGRSQAWNKGLTKENDKRIEEQSSRMIGENNHFFGKKHNDETIERIRFSKTLSNLCIEKRIKEREADFKLITDIDDYKSRQNQYLEFECTKCGEINKKTLQAFERGSLCENCFPVTRSQFEIEIIDFLKTKNIKCIANDRKTINPKELDILIEDYNLAIEANGLYWHSEFNDINKRNHFEKTQMCLEKGFSLIHFFNDEWNIKKDICKSMILHRLKKTETRIFARNCKIIELSKENEREFFNRNHISGFTRSKKCFGLEFNGKIVMALSLRSPLQKKYKDFIEIARFATEINHSVVGGLSKILKIVMEYAIDNNFFKILTYADRRFGEGKGYIEAGFCYLGSTGIDYWYTDGFVRYDRFSIRAKNGISEKDNAKNKKIAKVYGCGSNIYTYEINKNKIYFV